MDELSSERESIEQALNELNIQAWKFETHAGARPHSIQETYLRELEAVDLYIGIFWKGYGAHTIQEYIQARKIGIPCFIYEKRTELEDRAPQLQTFLDEISSVSSGITIQWFRTTDELRAFAKRDIAAWLAFSSRKGRHAEVREDQIQHRKQLRNRIVALTFMVLVFGLALGLIMIRSNEQHCIQDQGVAQNGTVHIFEAHYDGTNLRWWLQQPVEGFFSLASSSNFYFPKETLDAGFILSVRYDQMREYIWVGTSGKGLIRLARRDQDEAWVVDKKFDLASGLVDCQIQTILIDGQRIYLGPIDAPSPSLTFSDDGETWQQTPPAYKVSNDRGFHTFYGLASDGDSIWAGTEHGVYRFDGAAWFGPYVPEWNQDQEPNFLNVYDIAVGWGNIKWIATKDNGLLLLENINGTAHWLRPPLDLGIERVYSLDLFASGKQALIGTRQGLLICVLNNSEPMEVDCDEIEHAEVYQKPVFSLLLAPDDSQVLLGTDGNEWISLPAAIWEKWVNVK